MVFHSTTTPTTTTTRATAESPPRGSTRPLVIEDCADCLAAAAEFCTEDCIFEESECNECVPCFDEDCCCSEDVSGASETGSSFEQCHATATPFCTQLDCIGPADLSHLEGPGMPHYQQYDSVSESWAHLAHPPPANNQPIDGAHAFDQFYHGLFLERRPEDSLSLNNVPRLSFTSTTASEASEGSMLSRRNSQAILSGRAIARGMTAQYHCTMSDCDLSFFDNLQLDQHVMDEHMSAAQGSSAFMDYQAGLTGSEPLLHDKAQPRALHYHHQQPLPATVEEEVEEDVTDSHEPSPPHRCRWMVTDRCGHVSTCRCSFETAHELTLHLEGHIGTRQHTYTCRWRGCERNGKAFGQKQKILRHIVVHTNDRPFRCSECAYECSDESVLRQHERVHTGERPYRCATCHKTFAASTALSVHMRTHTGSKPLQCRFEGCEKMFSESSNMAKHMRTHFPGRPFLCDIADCDKRFQRSDQLKRHKKNTVHRRHMEEDGTCSRAMGESSEAMYLTA